MGYRDTLCFFFQRNPKKSMVIFGVNGFIQGHPTAGFLWALLVAESHPESAYLLPLYPNVSCALYIIDIVIQPTNTHHIPLYYQICGYLHVLSHFAITMIGHIIQPREYPIIFSSKQYLQNVSICIYIYTHTCIYTCYSFRYTHTVGCSPWMGMYTNQIHPMINQDTYIRIYIYICLITVPSGKLT